MAASTPSTIILKNAENCVQVEAIAGGAITPGHLVALNSSGQFVVNASAGAAAEKMFAVEDDGQGRGIGDAYDATTHKNVRAMICPPGTEVYAWVSAVTQDIAVGDKMESAGSGLLRELASGVALAVALEAKVVTSPAAGVRIKVRVI